VKNKIIEEKGMSLHRNLLPLAALSAVLLAGCASTPYTPTPYQAAPIDTTAYGPRVDAFVVLLDASSSMNDEYQGRQKFHIAKDVVANMNATIPPFDYRAGLVAFGTGSCTDGLAEVLYGLAPYQNADFAAGLDSANCAGGVTPMADGIDASTGLLSGETGPVAVIVASDFWDIDTNAVVAAVKRLKAAHGENLCLHTIQVGDDFRAGPVIAKMTGIAGCSSSVRAGDLASPESMANYVKDVLLAPVGYETTVLSATALFDFDKAVLKPQGRAAIRELDESIRAKGARVTDIDVVGHTCSIGSEEHNQGLSLRRAMAVKEYMVSDGIDAGLIDVIGKGESEPAASNSTPEGRRQNRRVEVHVGTAR
jgi:OOP family OmpA-OmpF porin